MDTENEKVGESVMIENEKVVVTESRKSLAEMKVQRFFWATLKGKRESY